MKRTIRRVFIVTSLFFQASCLAMLTGMGTFLLGELSESVRDGADGAQSGRALRSTRTIMGTTCYSGGTAWGICPTDPTTRGMYSWYFCPDSKNYSPYVKQCPKSWLRVVPPQAPPDWRE
ncbi:MAG: hypothetical protein ABSA46_19985 [Thermodesulfovibrionales bacterium]|jgi:hypothetical protein